MTWTTENDPPPPRPVPGSPGTGPTADETNADLDGRDHTSEADSTPSNVNAANDPDDTETSLFPEDGDGSAIEQDLDSDIEAIDSLVEDSEVIDSDMAQDKPSGLDQDGPLDPSVFDGLFADLATDSDPDDDAQAVAQTGDSSNAGADVDHAEAVSTTSEKQTSGQQASEQQTSDKLIGGQLASNMQDNPEADEQNLLEDSSSEDHLDPATPAQSSSEASARSNDRWTMPSPPATELEQADSNDGLPANHSNGYAKPVSPNEVVPPQPSGLLPAEVHPRIESPERFRPAGKTGPPGPVGFESHRQSAPELRPQAPRPPSTSSGRKANWIGIAAAIALGSALGLLGTFLLSSLRDSPEDAASPEGQSETVSDEMADSDGAVSAESDTTVVQDQGADVQSPATSFGADAIQFSAGTPDLAEQDMATLDRLAEILASGPETAATISVRSYSAETSAGNYDLSLAQSGAITNYLTAAGVNEEQFNVLPRGSAPFRPSQPVDGFVVVNPGIGQSDFKARLGMLNPFAVGLEPGNSNLRPDSLSALDQVGEAMTAIESSRLTLAAYSFSESSAETNKARASQAAQVASQYLQENHGIATERISTIAPGVAEYQIDSAWSNHVEVKIENESTPAFDIASLNSSLLTFESNSERITAEGQALLDEVAAVLTSSGATLVIEVFAFSAADGQANDQLSKAQASSINSYLTAKGVPELQVRAFGGGAAKQFEVVETPTTVVLSVVD